MTWYKFNKIVSSHVICVVVVIFTLLSPSHPTPFLQAHAHSNSAESSKTLITTVKYIREFGYRQTLCLVVYMEKKFYILLSNAYIPTFELAHEKKKIIKSTENILIGYYTQSHRVFRLYRRHIYYNGRCVVRVHTCVLWTCYGKIILYWLISILMVPEIYNHRKTLNITFSAASHTFTYTHTYERSG